MSALKCARTYQTIGNDGLQIIRFAGGLFIAAQLIGSADTKSSVARHNDVRRDLLIRAKRGLELQSQDRWTVVVDEINNACLSMSFPCPIDPPQRVSSTIKGLADRIDSELQAP